MTDTAPDSSALPAEKDQKNEVVESTHISYDDFAKLDIRIGTITAAEPVPETDKLLKLTVDFGSETRQIISGIKHLVGEVEALVGRQSPFVFNMAPRTIKGLESQGMILAAGDGETFSLLNPHHEIPAGTKVN